MTKSGMLASVEQDDLFGNSVAMGNTIDRAKLAAALAKIMPQMTLDGVVSIITNRYAALLEYISLTQGQDVGQTISLLFNPHRLNTRTKTSKMSIYQALKTEAFHSGLARATIMKQKQKTSLMELFYYTIQLGVNGVQYVNEFPPHVARDFCRSYGLNRASKVLDPCAGWGGRMIGTSVIAGKYVCYDPSVRTSAGLAKLLEFLRALQSDFDAEIYCMPYEDSTELGRQYDFAITSPPYYDSEVYSDEQSNSLNRYSTFTDWCAQFYLPLIDKTMRQLKLGSPFILNVGNRQYPLTSVLEEHSRDIYNIRELSPRLSNNSGLGKQSGMGESFYEITHAS